MSCSPLHPGWARAVQLASFGLVLGAFETWVYDPAANNWALAP